MVIQKKKIRINAEDEAPQKKAPPSNKKILYIEIDDEVTTIYDKLNRLKHKNVYLVIPQRAVIFQSAINLKILKRKAEDLDKNIFIVTNDSNGFNLCNRVGMKVYDKLEGQEHPSLVTGKFKENNENEITPLKASVNSLSEESPSRRNEKKFSISELVKRTTKGRIQILPSNTNLSAKSFQKKKENNNSKSSLVLIAPNKKALFALVTVSVILLMGISYIALPGATLILTPKSSVIEVPKNVILADVDRNRAELDTRPTNMIPSYRITTQIDKVFTFQATGKDAQGGMSSRGKIKIKNLSSNDWPLVPKTRFQTADGLVFRLGKQVSVPAGTPEKPGELEVEVVADPVDAFGQPIGDKGNLKGEVKFFLPALSAENQKKLFADSSGDFSGGVTNVVKFISKEDLQAAQLKMETELKNAAEAELKAVITKRNENQNTRLALLTGKNIIEYGTPKIIIPPNMEGQKLDSFDVKGSMVVSGVAYDLDELLGILKREIKMKKNPEKALASVDEDSLTMKIVDYDKNAQKITITATIQGIEEFEISPKKENGDRLIKKIKESIVGKDLREARDFIQNLPEIERVEIKTWPAWTPTLPSVPDNIKVEIKR
jgi:hypothetical protein